MDQIQIGRFIAQRRKLKNMTQMQLADMLGITDRAVSKWENGKGLPDASLMLDLSHALDISVNELLCGEKIELNNYNEKAEQQLLEMVREKEKKDRELLLLEIFIAALTSAILITCVSIASYITMDAWLRVILIVIGFIPFVIGVAFAVRIEQMAGYYECGACGHRYVPTYAQTLFSVHAGRTRRMKCPHCAKKSWSRKVLTKEPDAVAAEENKAGAEEDA